MDRMRGPIRLGTKSTGGVSGVRGRQLKKTSQDKNHLSDANTDIEIKNDLKSEEKEEIPKQEEVQTRQLRGRTINYSVPKVSPKPKTSSKRDITHTETNGRQFPFANPEPLRHVSGPKGCARKGIREPKEYPKEYLKESESEKSGKEMKQKVIESQPSKESPKKYLLPNPEPPRRPPKEKLTARKATRP